MSSDSFFTPAARIRFLIGLIGLCTFLCSPRLFAQFEPNRGQWDEDFSHRLRLNRGAVFVEDSGFAVVLLSGDAHEFFEQSAEERSAHAFRLRFVGAHPIEAVATDSLQSPVHFFRGSDRSKWKTDLYPASRLISRNLYPGIHLIIESGSSGLVFDFEVEPGADPEQIQWEYIGLDSISFEAHRLGLHTRLGSLSEELPGAVQTILGREQSVEVSYRITSQGHIGLSLGNYARDSKLLIDPLLVFSSFSGSSADNWGYTATYDEAGNIYGAGIAFGTGYPLWNGYQSSFAGGDVDVAISKLSPNGSQLLYSTYYGGNDNEFPHSLVVDAQNRLVILGSTGSPNLPMAPNAFDPSFNGGVPINIDGLGFGQGSDLFLAKFSSTGNQLSASSFYGGSGNDGINLGLDINYADSYRGEVVAASDGSVYIASVTRSTDIPVQSAHQGVSGGSEDALIAHFSANLNNLIWATYLGGSLSECANGIRLSPDEASVYVAGGSSSTNLSLSGHQGSYMGGSADGMLLRFNATSGALTASTFVGSLQRDMSFFVEVDKLGGVYVFGQSFGNIPVSPGVYAYGGGGQFIQKFSGNLQSRLWSTSIGNGSIPNMSPTAFRVDDCLNIFLSAWGGVTNTTGLGNMTNMPLTNNAFNPNTDGNQFYFAVLGPDAGSLVFASYFGGSSREHVDGGTSRFSPDGTIYQAVCAGCANELFPTTPGVYGPNNGSINCNLGLIKIDFETGVLAQAGIDANFESDTICDTIFVRFTNQSQHADVFYWDFGNGQFSTLANPIGRFDSLGTYEIRLIATDTVCDISDTAQIVFEHYTRPEFEMGFQTDFQACNPTHPVRFIPDRTNAIGFQWDFGDGSSSNLALPEHTYSGFGTYTAVMIATDSLCGYVDTVVADVQFESRSAEPKLEMGEFDCALKLHRLMVVGLGDSIRVIWTLPKGRSVESGSVLTIALEAGVPIEILATVFDTVCEREFSISRSFTPDYRHGALFVPDVFTPNGIGPNERFEISGDDCFAQGRLIIFDRWGGQVFETDRPYEEFWDGRRSGKDAAQGVYFYLYKSGGFEKRGSVVLIR